MLQQREPSNFGPPQVVVPDETKEPSIANPKPKKVKDPELERLDLQRKLLVASGRWKTKVEELNQEVTLALESAAAFEECNEVAGLLRARLERMYALLPSGGQNACKFPPDTEAAKFDRSRCRDNLSPLSSNRLKALDAPTKASIQDYEKTMVSAEQAVNKALNLLNKTSTELQVQLEKEKAREQRLEQLRSKRASESLKAIKQARDAGRAEADQEAPAEDDEEEAVGIPGEDEDHDDDGSGSSHESESGADGSASPSASDADMDDEGKAAKAATGGNGKGKRPAKAAKQDKATPAEPQREFVVVVVVSSYC